MTGYLSPGPAAEELALLLCVAVRIEPELIRAVRLDLLPAYDVGVEGDLWFSDWIGHRSAEAVQLRTEVAEPLRGELSRRLAGDPGGPLNRIGSILREVHGGLSPTLLLEEELQWAAVRVAAQVADATEIDRLLQPALRAVVLERRTGVVDWFTTAYRRLPASVQSSVTAWQLLQAAPRDIDVPAVADTPLDLTHIHALGDHVPTVNMPVRLDGDDLVLNETLMTRQHLLLPVPDTTPRLVRLRSESGTDRLLRIDVDRAERVSVGPEPVRITTGRGDVFEVGGRPDADVQDVAVETMSVTVARRTVPVETNRDLRDLARALRTRRVPVDEALVAAIEARVARARAGDFETADSLRLLGWVLYEASFEAVGNIDSSFEARSPEKRSLSETAFEYTVRLATAARELPRPHLAPRALGAIRAAALAEAKRDTIEGYDAAFELLAEARIRHQAYRELPGNDVDLDEMLLQLANAEVGAIIRMAERVILRWDDFASAENETRWLERLHRALEEAVEVGEAALAMAIEIGRRFGYVAIVSEYRLALASSPRMPALLTARACLLAAAISCGLEREGHQAAQGTWADARAASLRILTGCYRVVDQSSIGLVEQKPPLHTADRRALAQIRLGVALLFPGMSLPSANPDAPAMEIDPLDDEAAAALSDLLADERTSYRGDAGAFGGATMPAFIRAVEAARTERGAVTTYRSWRRRWPSLDRYAAEDGRQSRVDTVLALIERENAPDVPTVEVRHPDPGSLHGALVSAVVGRAMARDDLLAIAFDATAAVGMVQQREPLRRKITSEVDLLSIAFGYQLGTADGAGDDWAVRAQSFMHAGVVLRFAEMAEISTAMSVHYTSAEMHAASLRELGGNPPKDMTLEAFARYRAARDLRLAGRYEDALQLTQVPPEALFGSGVEPHYADFVYETGAAYLSMGEGDRAGTLFDELEPYFTTVRAAAFSRRYRFDLIRALVRWESGDGRAIDDLLSTQREAASAYGIGSLSVTLTAAELAVAAGRHADALSFARQAKHMIDVLRSTDSVVGPAVTPLAMALDRAYGDLALLAAGLGYRSGSDLGLRVVLAAGNAAVATAIRAERSSLGREAGSIIDMVVDAENGSRTLPDRTQDIPQLRRDLEEAVTPFFADLVLSWVFKVADLRRAIGNRYALDFMDLTDSQGHTYMFRTAIQPGGGLSFERLAPEVVDAAMSLARNVQTGVGTVQTQTVTDGLLPVDLVRSLAAANGEPIPLVISASLRLSHFPWPALAVQGPAGVPVKLIECAVITRTPLLTCLRHPAPPPVDGQALVRLVGLDENGVMVQAERAAWGLTAGSSGLPASAGPIVSAGSPTSTGRNLVAAMGDRGYDFLHLAAHGIGRGSTEQLSLPEGNLSFASATRLRWPRSALISAPLGTPDSFDMVLGLLCLGVECLVVGVESATDREMSWMAANVVRVLREGPVSLDVALRKAQMIAIAHGRPEREWTSLVAFVS